jgi:hypothetical protein
LGCLLTSIFNIYGKIELQRATKIRSTWRRGGAEMRGTKESLGMKEGTRTKSRKVGHVTTGKGVSVTGGSGKRIGHLETSHGTTHTSRKTSVRKGGTK